MEIHTDFPGGNIVVEQIGDHEVRLHQDLRDTEGPWFYWCFRVTGAEGRRVRFTFTESPCIGALGPAVSLDGGASWAWLGADAVEGNAFAYSFPEDAREVFFGMTIPYTEAHWNDFLSRHRSMPFVRETLCVTRQGRAVEMLRLGRLDATPASRVLITARHHCCETMASYVLEGMLAFLGSEDADARALRDCAEVLAVPFMDKDGSEAGDQGKNRRPRDHNRDYDGASLHAETAALRERIPAWSDGRLRVALDFHCPWLRGGDTNETIYLVGQSDPRISREQERFSRLIETLQRGPLRHRAADNIPFGTAWNVADAFKLGTSFARWAAALPGIRLASSVEIPYAVARGGEINAETARQFGADLGRALAVYVTSPDHP